VEKQPLTDDYTTKTWRNLLERAQLTHNDAFFYQIQDAISVLKAEEVILNGILGKEAPLTEMEETVLSRLAVKLDLAEQALDVFFKRKKNITKENNILFEIRRKLTLIQSKK